LTVILKELEDDKGWNQSFARSPEMLAKLAAEAMVKQMTDETIVGVTAGSLVKRLYYKKVSASEYLI